MASTTITILTQILAGVGIFSLVFFICRCIWVFLLKKVWCSMFKRKEINAIYNLFIENEYNKQFKHERVEKLIQAGFLNPITIAIAEKKFIKSKPTRDAVRFLEQAQANGYGLEEAKTLAISKGHKKKHLKLALKLNRQEIKNATKQKSNRQATSFEIPNEKSATASTTGSRKPSGTGNSTGANATAKPTAKSNTKAVAGNRRTDSEIAGQRNIQVRSPEKPAYKSRYFA